MTSSKLSQNDFKNISIFCKHYFPNHPREEEKRFNNQYLREHFLTSVYILAQFRILKNNKPSFGELYKFQAKNKYLFLTYNQVQMRKLGKLAANHSNHSIDKVLEEYESILFKLIRRKASFRSNLNTLEHVFGHFWAAGRGATRRDLRVPSEF